MTVNDDHPLERKHQLRGGPVGLHATGARISNPNCRGDLDRKAREQMEPRAAVDGMTPVLRFLTRSFPELVADNHRVTCQCKSQHIPAHTCGGLPFQDMYIITVHRCFHKHLAATPQVELQHPFFRLPLQLCRRRPPSHR